MVSSLIFPPLRSSALEADGTKQMSYTKSNDGWLQTLCVVEGRAFGRFLLPWAIVTINAIVWTIIAEVAFPERKYDTMVAYESFISLVLSTTLAFLLVFRLNRSSDQFWDSREAWGSIVALGKFERHWSQKCTNSINAPF
jgi:predicted membrane chloride channel (bestrophin family)